MTTVLDVTSASAVNDWIRNTVDQLGQLDGAANIAGIHMGTGTPIRSASDNNWEKVLDVNLNGVFYCLRAELNNIKQGGSIVNAASVAALIGMPEAAAYVVSKHAVLGLTRSAAREEGKNNIRVNCIAPGE